MTVASKSSTLTFSAYAPAPGKLTRQLSAVSVDVAQVLRIAQVWSTMPDLPIVKRTAATNLVNLAQGLLRRDQVTASELADLCSLGCRLCQHVRGGYCSQQERGSRDCVLGFHPTQVQAETQQHASPPEALAH